MRKKCSQDSKASKAGLSATLRKVRLSPSKATIVCAEPPLFVTDIKRSCEFFHEQLGFSLSFSYGDPSYYAQVGRNVAHFNLRCVEAPVIASTVRDGFQSAGLIFHQTLKK